MTEIKTPRCPVCGASADSAEKGETTCPVCGAENAFVEFFADPADIPLWREKANKYRAEVVERACKKQFGRSALSLGDRAAAVVTPGSQFLFQSNGDVEDTLTDAVQISFGGRHCLLLFRDGHVEARLIGGRRADQGQSRVEDWSEVTFVEAGANCSYGVRRDGTVLVSGIPPVPSENVVAMKDVRAIAEGEDFLVCLTGAGQLRVIVSAGAPEGLKTMGKAAEGCRNAVAVEAARGCALALDGNGRVHSFCSEKNDPRLGAGAWRDIAAVAVDSHYAVGLTRKGRLRLAGRESSMDAGRKDAVSWENNVALACAPSGIGAIALDGSLRLAGNIIGTEALKEICRPYAQRIAAAIIRQ